MDPELYPNPPPPPPPVWEPPPAPRRLGRLRATLLVTAGLVVGGGIGGYAIAQAAGTAAPSATFTPSTGSTSAGAGVAAATADADADRAPLPEHGRFSQFVWRHLRLSGDVMPVAYRRVSHAPVRYPDAVLARAPAPGRLLGRCVHLRAPAPLRGAQRCSHHWRHRLSRLDRAGGGHRTRRSPTGTSPCRCSR